MESLTLEPATVDMPSLAYHPAAAGLGAANGSTLAGVLYIPKKSTDILEDEEDDEEEAAEART